MSKHWERDLEYLQRSLLQQAATVEETIHKAIRALRQRDDDLARTVIAGDEAVNARENELENECLKMLALHQPVAIELRRVIAALKINNELERMADLSVNVCLRVLESSGQPLPPLPEQLQPMLDLTTAMVRQVLDAFIRLDPRLAWQVIRLDDEVDRSQHEILGGLLPLLQRHPELLPGGLLLLFAVRNLERVADHATNIAEDVIYLVEGEIVRHRKKPG
jgi:phosphate transport system protein